MLTRVQSTNHAQGASPYALKIFSRASHVRAHQKCVPIEFDARYRSMARRRSIDAAHRSTSTSIDVAFERARLFDWMGRGIG